MYLKAIVEVISFEHKWWSQDGTRCTRCITAAIQGNILVTRKHAQTHTDTRRDSKFPGRKQREKSEGAIISETSVDTNKRIPRIKC